MKRNINFDTAVIPGYQVRDVLKVFPEIELNFKQRKSFDEYYFESTEVEFVLNDLELLNTLDFNILISYNELTILF